MNIELNGKFSDSDFPKTKEKWLNKGDVFLYEGDEAKDGCYFILSGSLDVRLVSSTGHETLLYQLNEGELVGELSMFGAKARTATLVANSRVCLIEVSSAVFRESMSQVEFLEKLSAHFLRRYLKTHNVVCRLGQPNIGMKLCYYFKSLAEQLDPNLEKQKIQIRLPSHAILGKLLSCQRESVTRELKKLTQSDILEQVKGSEYILNMENIELYLGDMLD